MPLFSFFRKKKPTSVVVPEQLTEEQRLNKEATFLLRSEDEKGNVPDHIWAFLAKKRAESYGLRDDPETIAKLIDFLKKKHGPDGTLR